MTEDKLIPNHHEETNAEQAQELSASEGIPSHIRSIRDLIDTVTGRNLQDFEGGDAGFADQWPFPFLALVGQKEMKLGLLLSLINPNVGGVLLIGPRGTGKTTGVRSLIDLMPYVYESNCYYGCLEEDVEIGGIDALCPLCVEKYAKGEKLSSLRPAKLVELPLNAKMEDVLGTVDERSAAHAKMRVKRGILSYADRNLLYIDEVNLLKDDVVDVILDAAAQGSYTVRRGQFSATYRSRFTLIGTMNPEEGSLRPQILDRFGLRLFVKGLEDLDERYEAYKRSATYLSNPKKVVDMYAEDTLIAREELLNARKILQEVDLPHDIAKIGLALIKELGIASIRAEITLFEAARALAAADGRVEVTKEDLYQIAPMALRLRRSKFIEKYFQDQHSEEDEILKSMEKFSDKENAK
jgi:magnesium chelatase subunit I